MNCKPGDLAIVVDSIAGNEGKIVQCIRLTNKTGVFNVQTQRREVGPVWHVEPSMLNAGGFPSNFCGDHQLRPIRDPGDDATDETLTWLPSPVRERVSQ